MIILVDNVCEETRVHINYCGCGKHRKNSKPYIARLKKDIAELKKEFVVVRQKDLFSCIGCGKRLKLYHNCLCRSCYYKFLQKKHFG